MKHTFRKLASVLTALCMLVSLFPAALAALPVAYEYVQDTDGVDSGTVYAIYYGGTSNGSILYHTGSGTTDQVGGTVAGDTLTLNGGFAVSRQLWTIVSAEGGYTLQSVDSGRYLDLSQPTSSKVNTAQEAVTLTISLLEDGTYTVTHTSGNALSHGTSGQYYSSSSATPLYFYKQTEVEPSMAPGAPSGSSAGQPFVKEDTNSTHFRIPALLTLDNGWIAAASDIRWRTDGDSPQNLDTIVSLSKDGGATWDWNVVNYYDDMADDATGQTSASFIDPSILQAEDGTVHMVVDACPSYVGLMYGNQMGWESSGFDDAGRLLVTLGTSGGNASKKVADYTYYADINNPSAGAEQVVGGEAITLYPICKAEDDSQTGAWVDAWLNVYTEEDGVITPDLCLQLQSSDAVQSNLFYRNSQWKAYPVFYIMHRSADVTADGLVWSDPQFLDIKLSEDEAFTGVCPGRGLSFQYEGHERLVFPLYDNATGTELASVIYSDDGGQTWTRGQHNADLNGVGKTSESQVVLLPDGTLRMYSRNTIHYISYADSTDGGETWGTCQKDMALGSRNPGNGCMVSFINLDGILVGPDNTIYENLILASYPVVQRKQGVVRIGYVDGENVVHWLNDDEPRYQGAGNFSYSCVTQLPEGDAFGILYEYGNETNTIQYETLTVNDLLGQGWYLLSGTENLPSISLDQAVVDLKAGETAKLTATYPPTGAEVTWTSSNPAVATVEGGVVTAVAPGTSTITASVTSSGITRTASADVAVQGNEGVILPDRYTDQMEENYHEASTTYALDDDGIDSGSVYAIFHSNSNRILYHASGSTTSDQVTGSVSNSLLNLDSGYLVTRQTWTVTGDAESGYTIQSCEADGRYLNLNTATNAGSKVPVTDESQALTITPVDGSAGSYTVSRMVGDQTLYLAHENGTKQHYVGTEAVPFQFYRQVITEAGYTYTTSADGLNALITDLSTLKESDYTASSWAALQNALTAARAVAKSESFDSQEAAQAAQAVVDQAAKDLYAAKLGLTESSGDSGSGGSSSGGGSAGVTRYTITASAGEGGSITPSGSVSVNYNSDKAFTITADEGFEIADVVVNGKSVGAVASYTFENVRTNHTIKATFAKSIDESDTPLGDLPFTDVAADAWYAEAVSYAVEKGLMTGTSSTTFSPEMTFTRSMMAQILYNLECKPSLDNEILGYPYADVAGDTWYADAVYWARLKGLISGYSDEKFGPNDSITREQLVSILYRYASYQQQDVSAAADLSVFSDAEYISPWAADSLKWAVAEGILSGKGNGQLDPTGTASRGEVAQMFWNYMK